ncbi:MAG TPA: NAD(P)/FAD-dependent oxidoreductase [Verrucomicrobiae bacterium]|nr:NAD(P)/FAD-dependent oxidoreductase [Verrucomicrobiae bacterium]
MPIGQKVVLIGGGHNALITAFYLAKGGFRPLVLERRSMIGGGAVTEEFYPGFKASTLAHTLGPLRADIVRDMQLERFDLHLFRPDPRVFAPAPDGRGLLFYDDAAKTAGSISHISARDGSKYAEFAKALEKIAGVFSQIAAITPPGIDKPSPEDLWNLLNTGRGIRKLGKRGMLDLLRWGPMAVADFVAEFFETELLRAVIAARGIFGANLGPWSAGSTAVLLLRAAADPHPVGPAVFPRGGLGELSRAMSEAAKKAGAEIRTDAEVVQIRTKSGAVSGVVLANGEEVACDAVVSGVDPKRTFVQLLEPAILDPVFALRMKNFRARGNVAKVHLALGDLPNFPSLANAVGPDGFREALSGRIHIGHEIDYLEKAFDASKYGEISTEPYLDVTIPTLLDPSLAPNGKHVMSAYFQFAPYQLREGNWNDRRGELANTLIKTLGHYSPNLANLVEGAQVITPLDLEETYGYTGGHIFHGELALDQIFTMRPVLDWAKYRTPVRGLFLCGNGTHPGNGLTGASGANAVKQIIHELR